MKLIQAFPHNISAGIYIDFLYKDSWNTLILRDTAAAPRLVLGQKSKHTISEFKHYMSSRGIVIPDNYPCY